MAVGCDLFCFEWLTWKTVNKSEALSLGYSCYYGRVKHGIHLMKKADDESAFSLGEFDFTGYPYLPRQFEKG